LSEESQIWKEWKPKEEDEQKLVDSFFDHSI
jgi:hypothetical protein